MNKLDLYDEELVDIRGFDADLLVGLKKSVRNNQTQMSIEYITRILDRLLTFIQPAEEEEEVVVEEEKAAPKARQPKAEATTE